MTSTAFNKTQIIKMKADKKTLNIENNTLDVSEYNKYVETLHVNYKHNVFIFKNPIEMSTNGNSSEVHVNVSISNIRSIGDIIEIFIYTEPNDTDNEQPVYNLYFGDNIEYIHNGALTQSIGIFGNYSIRFCYNGEKYTLVNI